MESAKEKLPQYGRYSGRLQDDKDVHIGSNRHNFYREVYTSFTSFIALSGYVYYSENESCSTCSVL